MKNEVKNTIYLTNIAFEALGLPKDGYMIESHTVTKDFLLQEDTLVPILSSISNTLGKSILFADKEYCCIHPIDLIKYDDSLCFAKAIKSSCENEAPKSYSMLFMMEAVNSVVVKRNDGKYDLTNLIRKWREILSPLKEGKKVNIEDLNTQLISENVMRLSDELGNRVLRKV